MGLPLRLLYQAHLFGLVIELLSIPDSPMAVLVGDVAVEVLQGFEPHRVFTLRAPPARQESQGPGGRRNMYLLIVHYGQR